MKKTFGFSLLLLALVMSVGCGGVSRDDVSISIMPNEVIVETGKSALLGVNVKNTDFKIPRPGSLAGTYTRVGLSNINYTAGSTTANAFNFIITATEDKKKTATASIRVVWARPTLTITPALINLQPGKVQEVTVDTRFFTGSPKTGVAVVNPTLSVFPEGLGTLTLIRTENNVAVFNTTGDVSDVIHVRRTYNFTASPGAEAGIEGSINATGTYQANATAPVLNVAASARLTIAEGVSWGPPPELDSLNKIGNQDGSLVPWWESEQYNDPNLTTLLTGANIPANAYVYGAFGGQNITTIAGYEKVDIAALAPGKWSIDPVGSYQYVVIVPPGYKRPDELESLNAIGNQSGLEAPWSQTEQYNDPSLSTLLTGANIPDSSYVYGAFAGQDITGISGYAQVDIEDLEQGKWSLVFVGSYNYVVIDPRNRW